MESKKIEKCGLDVNTSGVKLNSKNFRILDLVYNVTIEKKDDIYEITGEKPKFIFHMYENFKKDDISKIVDEDVLYKKRYILFGEEIPYIVGYCELKKREPFTITTTNLTIVE